jgi:hypothetical protein
MLLVPIVHTLYFFLFLHALYLQAVPMSEDAQLKHMAEYLHQVRPACNELDDYRGACSYTDLFFAHLF